MILLPSLMVFMMLYIISFIMVIGMNDWFMIWMGLEINMLSFILMMYKKDSINNIESCLKYFFIQSVGSAMVLAFLYINDMSLILSYLLSVILIYKLGGGVFFFWFPSVCSGVGWWSIFFLMTFQKIMPMMLLNLFLSKIMWYMSMISLVVGVMGSFNQVCLKQLMAYSSIHHMGWMFMCIMIKEGVWMIYLLTYSIMIYSIIMMVKLFNINNLLMMSSFNIKFWFFISLMSIAGIPPFLGFFLKWIVFFYMDVNYMMTGFVIIMSTMMLYIYIRMVYNMMLGEGIKLSWFNKNNYFKYMMFDFLNVFGVLFGGLIIFIFKMYNIKK